MWKKQESERERAEPTPPSRRAKPAAGKPPGRRTAVIGPSLKVKGDIKGKEDLVVDGQVDGKIDLRQHRVTIGRSGRVKADVHAASIQVEGQVHGNLYGEKEVVIRESGVVEGNIVGPRVVLEDGSKFKGSIDMEPREAGKPASPPRARESTPPAAARPAGSAKVER